MYADPERDVYHSSVIMHANNLCRVHFYLFVPFATCKLSIGGVKMRLKQHLKEKALKH